MRRTARAGQRPAANSRPGDFGMCRGRRRCCFVSIVTKPFRGIPS